MRIAHSLFAVVLLQALLVDPVDAAAKKAHPQPLFSTDQRLDSGFVVPMTLDGKSYNFLFDTGSSLMVIDHEYADVLAAKPTMDQIGELKAGGMSLDDDGNLSASTPMGVVHVQIVLAKSLSFGPLQTMEDFPATVADLIAVGIPDLAGIYPMIEIQQFTWVMENGRLSAYDPQAFISQKARGSCAKLTMNQENGTPNVPIEVGQTRLMAQLDTGEDGMLRLTAEQIADLKAKKLYTKTRTGEKSTLSGVSSVEFGMVTQIKLGSTTLKDVRVSEAIDTAIGTDLLARFRRVALEFEKERICFDG